MSTRRSSIAQAATSKLLPDKPVEVRSDKVRGLILRTQPSGVKTYYLTMARGKRVKIGRADVFTLAMAEERAKQLWIDPSAATTKSREGVTLKQYVDDVYKDFAIAQTRTGQATVDRVLSRWPTLVHQRMSDINASDIDKLRTKRLNSGVTANTVNRDVAALAGVMKHWSKEAKAPNPLTGLGLLKVDHEERIRYLTPEEEKRLRKALPRTDYLKAMVLLSLLTGIRRGEMFSLEWQHVDMKLRTLTVTAANAKGRSTRVVPLNDEAYGLLQKMKPEKASGYVFVSPRSGERFDNVTKAWKAITATANLPDLRWHDLRHSFASALVMKGVALYVVQKLLGHASPLMTQRYARLAPDALADAVAKLGTTKR